MTGSDQEGKELFAAFLRLGNPEVETLALRYYDHWRCREDRLAEEIRALRAKLDSD